MLEGMSSSAPKRITNLSEWKHADFFVAPEDEWIGQQKKMLPGLTLPSTAEEENEEEEEENDGDEEEEENDEEESEDDDDEEEAKQTQD